MTLPSASISAFAPLLLLLSLQLHVHVTTATMCMACSWSGVEHPSKICADEDISSLTAEQRTLVYSVNCGAQKCNVRRVINRSTGKVHSISRGCSPSAPQSTKCSSSVYFTTCETICSTDNCNVKETLPKTTTTKKPTYKPKSTTRRYHNNASGGIVVGRVVATSRCLVSAATTLLSICFLL